MLIEMTQVKQYPDEEKKRWFADSCFDLIVWQDARGEILRFELCYDKEKNEHALIWSGTGSCLHLRVDDGEGATGRYKMSPILLSDGLFDWETIAKRFEMESREIDSKISYFVLGKLQTYGKKIQG